MKAICIKKPNDISVIEVDDQEKKKNESLIKIEAIGICGSDIAAYKYNHPNVTYPVIIGHEAVGEIIELDIGNSYGLQIGDKVLLDPYLYCGECYPCRNGSPNCCEHLRVLGCQTDGSMREYFRYPTRLLKKVPSNLSCSMATMAEPLSIALHSINKVKPRIGDHVVVVGAGTIGVMAAMLAKMNGAQPILIDILQNRLNMAKEKFGIDNIINSNKEDSIEKVSKITKGRMAECVIEASGSSVGIQSTVHLASYTGRIAYFGWPKEALLFETSLITKKELTLKGSRCSHEELDICLELLLNKEEYFSDLITKVVKFNEIPQTIEDLAKNGDQHFKIVGMLN